LPINWRNFKAVIRDTSARIYRKHRSLCQQVAAAAETAAATAHSLLAANTDPARHSQLLASARAASDAVLTAWWCLLDPAELAGRILDHQFGDQSTFYFFHGARKPVQSPVQAHRHHQPQSPWPWAVRPSYPS
jgi:hypothetical protein